MGQEGRALVLESSGATERNAARGQALADLMHHTLGHLQSTRPPSDDQQPLAVGLQGRPDPVGRALQARERLVRVDRTCLEVSQHGGQVIQLQLLDMQGTEKLGRKGCKRLRRFDEPGQHRIGIDRKAPGSSTHAEPFG